MDSVLQVMVEEEIGPGERCQSFTQAFAESVSCPSATAFRTYPDCIKTALLVMGATEGTVVAVSPLAPSLYNEILEELKCKVVFVDVDRENGLPDEEAVAKSNAEILVLYENCGSIPMKYNSETTFADKCEYSTVSVLEDVTESLGAHFRDEAKAGDWGKTVVCAFEEDSLVSSSGGAALAVRGDMVYSLRGKRPSSYRRMPDLNAALGKVQLNNLEENSLKRRDIVKVYEQSLKKTKHRKFGLTLLDYETPAGSFSVFLNCKPDEVIKFAEKKDVPVKMTFGESILKTYDGDPFNSFPVAAAFFYRTVSFPVYPFLKNSEIDEVNKIIAHLP